MNKIFLSVAVLFLCLPAFCQDKIEKTDDITSALVLQPDSAKSKWSFTGKFSVLLNANHTNNFADLGETFSMITGSGHVKLGALYNHDKFFWSSRLEYSYSFNKRKDYMYHTDLDFLYVTSRFFYKIKNKIFATAILDVITQLTPGYLHTLALSDPTDPFSYEEVQYKVSNFLTPGSFYEALGFAYLGAKFYIGVAPIAFHQSIKIDDECPEEEVLLLMPDYSIKEEFSIGAYMKAGFNSTIGTKGTFSSELTVFSKYDKMDDMSALWMNSFAYRLGKYLTLSAKVILAKDFDDSELHVKQNYGIGFSYSFKK